MRVTDDFFCSFCGKRRGEVKKLVSGPRVFICNECVGRCREVIGPRPAAVDEPDPLARTTMEDILAQLPPHAQLPTDDEDVTAERRPPDDNHCSFCGKPKHKVSHLVSGPAVYICNECVELCEDVAAD